MKRPVWTDGVVPRCEGCMMFQLPHAPGAQNGTCRLGPVHVPKVRGDWCFGFNARGEEVDS